MKCHRLFVGLSLIFAAIACKSPQDSALTADASSAAATAAPSASLYDLSLVLTDQDGRSLGLDAFRGHPVVVSMFYSRCGYACPTLLSDIQRFERSLPPEIRDDLRVLIVSFDTAGDTPERLKALAIERKLDEKRWRLAQASEEHVRELAAALSMKYRKLDDGGFNHSSSLTLLDREGAAVERVEGLSQPLDSLVRRTAAVFEANRRAL